MDETLAIPKAPNALLQLPGGMSLLHRRSVAHINPYRTEIRNIIYKFLAQPRRISFGTQKPYRIWTPDTHGALLCWSLRGRNTLGLSQTCRKLRREFLPLLEARSTVVIGMHLVDRYIEDFYPDGTGARGRLIIRARRRGKALELGKLLRLYTASPALRVGCYRKIEVALG